MSAPRTIYDKIFDDHVVDRQDDGTCLLYIDRHLVHEVTSPQAFEGLRMSGRKVRFHYDSFHQWQLIASRQVFRTIRKGCREEQCPRRLACGIHCST